MKYGCCLFHLLTLTSLVIHLPLVNTIAGRKTTEINLAAFLVEHTNTRATDMDVNTRKSTLSSHKQANKHIITIHKQKYTHTHRGGERPCIPRPVGVYLKTRGSCESSQVGLLCMYMGARKTLLTAVRHFDCPARLLRPKPPNTPTSLHRPLPPHPPPHTPRPDGFFF